MVSKSRDDKTCLHNHYISNLRFCCFSCIIAMVHQNSQTVELWWEKIRVKTEEGQYGTAFGFKEGQYVPSVHFRRANTETYLK